ncbi:hypothetical protein ACIBL8_09215 [Streptomyces sp. NPDC050523]|uniref:hypothetical protein n=1 Tax=Streptomyces sp. NPDC050523 TaxID=3365622 RepID=UPI0037A1F001
MIRACAVGGEVPHHGRKLALRGAAGRSVAVRSGGACGRRKHVRGAFGTAPLGRGAVGAPDRWAVRLG